MNNASEVSLLGLRYTLKDATISVADQPFDAEGHHFEAGSLLIQNADVAKLNSALGRRWSQRRHSHHTAVAPQSTTRLLPRIAFMHTWLGTQTEGWWRLAFDKTHVPYDYISTQTVAQTPDLRSKYDVIIFAPVGRSSTQQVIDGMPMWGNPLPWEKTDLTPNLGRIDSTPDMRPGLTYAGVDHLKDFISKGGLFITSEDTAQFAIDLGLAPGVFVAPRRQRSRCRQRAWRGVCRQVEPGCQRIRHGSRLSIARMAWPSPLPIPPSTGTLPPRRISSVQRAGAARRTTTFRRIGPMRQLRSCLRPKHGSPLR